MVNGYVIDDISYVLLRQPFALWINFMLVTVLLWVYSSIFTWTTILYVMAHYIVFHYGIFYIDDYFHGRATPFYSMPPYVAALITCMSHGYFFIMLRLCLMVASSLMNCMMVLLYAITLYYHWLTIPP